MDPAEYAERRRVADEQYKADYGQMALDIRNCLVDGAYKNLTPQDWWVDRIWKSRGVEYLNVEKYIEKVYNKPKSKWLVCFGSASIRARPKSAIFTCSRRCHMMLAGLISR